MCSLAGTLIRHFQCNVPGPSLSKIRSRDAGNARAGKQHPRRRGLLGENTGDSWGADMLDDDARDPDDAQPTGGGK